MPGMTAYAGLLEIGKPQAGETVVVSAASGALGSVVGQIARIKGARAVGVAGGPDKCRYVKEELGFDECVNHRDSALGEKAQGGGSQGDRCLLRERVRFRLGRGVSAAHTFARIPVCGLIAQYSATEAPDMKYKTSQIFRAVLSKRLTIRGFIVTDFAAKFPEFIRDMPQWIKEGHIRYREDVVEGLEQAPRALIGLLRGENFGKMLVRVAGEAR